MLMQKVIKPAQKEWAAPTVFAPGKNGSLRLSVDCKKLNAVTKRGSYLIPRIDECIVSLGETAVFCTLDSNSDYWRVELKRTDCGKTLLTSHHGLYHFSQMPSCLMNTPRIISRTMDVFLSQVKWKFTLTYLYDIAFFFRSPCYPFKYVKRVLSLIRYARVDLKLKKYNLFTRKINFLGQVIRPCRLRIGTHKTYSINGLKPPTNISKLRLFLGLCIVSRRFVLNFARIAAPLIQKLRKDQPMHFVCFHRGSGKRNA